MRVPAVPLDGILLVDKPAGLSSAEITNRLKRRFRPDRIGHGGTLDPFATGLLVVLLGEATKISRFLLEGAKEYEASAVLGVETDTGDHTGEIVSQCESISIGIEEWRRHASAWTGRIRQTPPIYSAIKVKGRPLYDYARKGESVELKERDAEIFSLDVLSACATRLDFRVRCSGGTYIRALAADLAMAAGTSAHLKALRRLASSAFRVESALALDHLLSLPEGEAPPLLPLEAGLSHLPQLCCAPALAAKVRQGNLAALELLRPQLGAGGFFLLLESHQERNTPVAVCNHHPMLTPACSIERVFDPRLGQP